MNNQKHQMKWILSWVFLLLFIAMVLCTLSMVFLGFGSPTEGERNLLVKVLIGEVAASVFALFYSIFGINRKFEPDEDMQNEKMQELIIEIGKLERRIASVEGAECTTLNLDGEEIVHQTSSLLSKTEAIIESFKVEPPFSTEEYRQRPLPKEIEEDLSSSKPFDLKHREQSYIGSKVQWKATFRSINKGGDCSYSVRANVGFLHTLAFEIDEDASYLLRHLEIDAPFWVCGEISGISSLSVELKNAEIYTGA